MKKESFGIVLFSIFAAVMILLTFLPKEINVNLNEKSKENEEVSFDEMFGTVNVETGSGWFAECQQGASYISTGSGTDVQEIDIRDFESCYFSSSGLVADTMELSFQVVPGGRWAGYRNAAGTNPWAASDDTVNIDVAGLYRAKWERTGSSDGDIDLSNGCKQVCR